MANNLDIKDGAGVSRTLKTTETSSVHRPHHLLDLDDGASGYQPMRGNIVKVLLGNASRSSSTAAAIQTNYNGCGIVLYVSLRTAPTPIGTNSLSIALYQVDPDSCGASGGVLAQFAGIAGTGVFPLIVYP